jgi:ATP-dependent DNA helicase DinG
VAVVEQPPGLPPSGRDVGANPTPLSTRTAVVAGRAWSAVEDEQLREGVQVGCTVEDLADQFDCAPATVAMRLAMLNLAAPSEAETR